MVSAETQDNNISLVLHEIGMYFHNELDNFEDYKDLTKEEVKKIFNDSYAMGKAWQKGLIKGYQKREENKL